LIQLDKENDETEDLPVEEVATLYNEKVVIAKN
jgi:hypothetical protein